MAARPSTVQAPFSVATCRSPPARAAARQFPRLASASAEVRWLIKPPLMDSLVPRFQFCLRRQPAPSPGAHDRGLRRFDFAKGTGPGLLAIDTVVPSPSAFKACFSVTSVGPDCRGCAHASAGQRKSGNIRNVGSTRRLIAWSLAPSARGVFPSDHHCSAPSPARRFRAFVAGRTPAARSEYRFQP